MRGDDPRSSALIVDGHSAQVRELDMKHRAVFSLVMLLCAVGSAAGPATAPAPVTADIEELLDRRFSEVSFDGTPLDKALDILREPLKVNIVVNWVALHKLDVEPTTPITLRLKDVTLRQALAVVITLIGDGKPQIGYRIDENILTITDTQFAAPDQFPTKVYNVRDLIDAAVARRKASMPAPDPNLQNSALEDGEADELRRLVIETVDPELWRERGGQPGIISAWSGMLVVSNSPAVQGQVAEFLAKLRQAPPAVKSRKTK
jgi:hypothetical protein